MTINFKKYQKKYDKDLVQCVELLQDFLVKIDPLKLLRRLPGYGRVYTNSILNKVKKNNGLILLAYHNEKVVGCVIGMVEKQLKKDLLCLVPIKMGRISDLFISEDYRRYGIGKKLMRKMEFYFKKIGCDAIKIDVFEPNKSAHRFYLKRKFVDRGPEMIKLLKGNISRT